MRIQRTASALAVCATLMLAVTACAAENADPRAFAGTDPDESLDKILKSYELTLPSCEVKDLGFTGRSREIGKHLLLRFQAPRDCVDTYLDAHLVDGERPIQWPFGPTTIDGKELSPTAPPFPGDAMDKFGLKLDPKKTYDLYTRFETSTDAIFDVLIVPKGDQQVVYMYSTYNGED